jgi:hypothetical protein
MVNLAFSSGGGVLSYVGSLKVRNTSANQTSPYVPWDCFLAHREGLKRQKMVNTFDCDGHLAYPGCCAGEVGSHQALAVASHRAVTS